MEKAEGESDGGGKASENGEWRVLVCAPVWRTQPSHNHTHKSKKYISPPFLSN